MGYILQTYGTTKGGVLTINELVWGLLLESPLWSVMSAYILDLFFRHAWLSARFTMYPTAVCTSYKFASCWSDDRLDWSLLWNISCVTVFIAVLITKYLFYKCVSYNVHPTFLVKDTHGRELIFATEVNFQGDGYYSNEFHDIYVLHPHFVFFTCWFFSCRRF